MSVDHGPSRLRQSYEQFRDLPIRLSAAERQAMWNGAFGGSSDQADAMALAWQALADQADVADQAAMTEEQRKSLTERASA